MRTLSTVTSEAIPCLPRERADSLASQLVVWQGRVCPFSTLATDVTRRITGTARPYGYTPEQVVASWALYPEVWNGAPLILIDNKELRTLLGLTGRRASLYKLYDAEGYRLQRIADAQADTTTALYRAIRRVDDRVRLAGQLADGSLVAEAPATAAKPSATLLRLEVLNNRYHIFDILFTALMLAAALLFLRSVHRKRK